MARGALIWGALAVLIAMPLLFAAASPLLQWRAPIYIASGFAGIVGLALILVQPLLADGALPGLPARAGRLGHRVVGGGLVAAVAVHVGGLWITTPPDVIDALTFTAPTWFSVWGVLAMWGVLATACVALLRRRMPLRRFRALHLSLGLAVVAGTVAHTVLIDGTMEWFSKVALCTAVVGVAGVVLGPRLRGVLRSSRSRS